MKRLLLYLFLSITLCISYSSNILHNSFSSVFNLPANKWEFVVNKPVYGVDIIGYLKGYTWKSSPVIIYAETIRTNYYFDLYTKLEKMKKPTKFKDIKFYSRTLSLDTSVPYEITYWVLPNVVHEYISYFGVEKNYIVSIVMSSKEKKYIKKYYNDYKVLLRNFAKIAYLKD